MSRRRRRRQTPATSDGLASFSNRRGRLAGSQRRSAGKRQRCWRPSKNGPRPPEGDWRTPQPAKLAANNVKPPHGNGWLGDGFAS